MEEKVDTDKLISLGDSHAVYVPKQEEEGFAQLMVRDDTHVKDHSNMNNISSNENPANPVS